MPRKSKGAHLRLEQPVVKDGKLVRRATWLIIDRKEKHRTGCGADELEEAQRLLKDYLASKYEVSRDEGKSASSIPVADVINVYATDKGPHVADPKSLQSRLTTLLEWWGDKMLSDVNGKSCRDYVKHRLTMPWKRANPAKTGTPPRMMSLGGIRRELEDLQAAINYHFKEGLCSQLVAVTLPQKAQPKDVFLTRSEAAKLIWTAWRAKEVQRGNRTSRYHLKHIARFVLCGLYTGTRHTAICTASFKRETGKGFVNLETGVFQRLALGKKQTKKRQPPARLPNRLLAHIRRWKRVGVSKEAVIEESGLPVKSVRRGFASAMRLSGIDKHVTPHTLRHTSATWMMQEGVDIWQASGFLGMSVKMLQDVYGHHHPDFQEGMATAFQGPSRSK